MARALAKGSTFAELGEKASKLSAEIATEISSTMDNYYEGRHDFYRERGLTYWVETEEITSDDGVVGTRELAFLAPIDAEGTEGEG